MNSADSISKITFFRHHGFRIALLTCSPVLLHLRLLRCCCSWCEEAAPICTGGWNCLLRYLLSPRTVEAHPFHLSRVRTRCEQAQLQDGGDDEPAGSVSSPAATEDKQAPPPDPSLLGKADEERRAILRGSVLCDDRRPPPQVVEPRRSRLFRWLLQIQAPRPAGAVPPEPGAPRSEDRPTCFLLSTSDHQLTIVAAWCRRGSAANEPIVSAAIPAAAEPTSNATDSPAAFPSPATVAIVQLSSTSISHTTATASFALPCDPIPSISPVPWTPTRLLFKEGLPMNELLSPRVLRNKKRSSKKYAFLLRKAIMSTLASKVTQKILENIIIFMLER